MKKIWENIRNTPTEIKLFFLFSLLITVSSKILRLKAYKNLEEQIIPITGWVPESTYGWFIFFIPFCIIVFSLLPVQNENPPKYVPILRFTITLMMITGIILGIMEFLRVTPEDYTDSNPYLRYDSFRPAYTIGLPLIWLLVIGGSFVKSLLNHNKNKQNSSLV